MIIKSFEWWRLDQLRALEAEDPEEADYQAERLVTCPDCQGTGEVGYGIVTEQCERCWGDGVISSSEISSGENADLMFTRERYIQEVADDLVALARWHGEHPLKYLAAKFMAPHSPLITDESGKYLRTDAILLRDPEAGGLFQYTVPQGST